MDNLSAYICKCAMSATSNRPAEVDACLRRGGRFEKEVDVLESSEDDRYR